MVDLTMGEDGIRLSAEEKRRRRRRSLAIAAALVAVVLLFYMLTILKLGPAVLDRAL